MIKLFRHIRRSLLAENKFSKYLLYAIGEIVLVVFGILIALAINNRNEENAKNEQVDLYLQNLTERIEEDQERFANLFQVANFRYHSIQYLLKMSGNAAYDATGDGFDPPPYQSWIWEAPVPQEYDSAFVDLAYLWSHRISLADLNTSVLDEMKSTGTLSQIKDDQLKESIYEYYRFWSVAQGSIHKIRHDRIISDWERSLGEEGVVTSEVNKLDNPLVILVNNPKRAYLLKRMARESGWHLTSLNRSKLRADSVLSHIKDYQKPTK